MLLLCGAACSQLLLQSLLDFCSQLHARSVIDGNEVGGLNLGQQLGLVQAAPFLSQLALAQQLVGSWWQGGWFLGDHRLQQLQVLSAPKPNTNELMKS